MSNIDSTASSEVSTQKPKKTKKGAKWILSIFAVSLAFAVGYLFGYKGLVVSYNKYPEVSINRDLPAEQEDLDFQLFWRVWDTLDSRYFDKEKLIPGKMVYGAIRGLVESVGDPYTVFLPPKENRVVQEDLSGNFEGVGIQIGFIGSQLAVIAPLPDSPAEKAGIHAKDIIAGIKDDEKGVDRGTVGITIPEAVQAIRGEAGTTVTLLVLREDEPAPLVIDVVRESINVPSIVVDYLDTPEGGRVAHVKLLKFAGETVGEWDKLVLEMMTDRELTGVIIDVRNNPGGYLQGAVDLASDFLETDDLVVVEESGSGVRQEFRVEKLGRLKSLRVAMLVNGGSASASEILAGALRDNKQVPLIGETTFGKGTIQEPQQVGGDAGFHITIAKWLTPSGYWVNEIGLEPDSVVENDPETEEDEQLQEALNLF